VGRGLEPGLREPKALVEPKKASNECGAEVLGLKLRRLRQQKLRLGEPGVNKLKRRRGVEWLPIEELGRARQDPAAPVGRRPPSSPDLECESRIKEF